MIIVNPPDLSITVQASGTVDVNVGSLYFEFIQSSALTVWEIEHNLNKPHPFVFVKDSQGNEVVGAYSFINNNLGTLTFLEPVTGKAWLS